MKRWNSKWPYLEPSKKWAQARITEGRVMSRSRVTRTWAEARLRTRWLRTWNSRSSQPAPSIASSTLSGVGFKCLSRTCRLPCQGTDNLIFRTILRLGRLSIMKARLIWTNRCRRSPACKRSFQSHLLQRSILTLRWQLWMAIVLPFSPMPRIWKHQQTRLPCSLFINSRKASTSLPKIEPRLAHPMRTISVQERR